MSANGAQIVQIRGLSKFYAEGERTRAVLEAVDLDIREGEFLVLLGKSGSGKSTLLNLLSGIDQADSGSVVIDNTDISHLDERRLTLFRRQHLGIIFQFFNLIPTLTVLENVTLPLELSGQTGGEKRARSLLDAVGLGSRAHDFPDKLSGGEQQRVAIARALVNEPSLVLADEPTGNLDEETGKQVLALLLELTRDAGRTLVMATHNPEIVPLADTVCQIHDHKVIVTLRESVKELMS
ncbi:MAG: ATP-binding cassette domain-containing protein [Chloroflexi bacterium]|nr:ATP-binding cassette domain-containing protein [Chloroflexota bacterium]